MKVLVATDGSENSLKAVKRALELAEKEGAKVTLISVAYYSMDGFDDMPLKIQEKLQAEANEALEKGKSLFDKKARLELVIPFEFFEHVLWLTEDKTDDLQAFCSRCKSKFHLSLFDIRLQLRIIPHFTERFPENVQNILRSPRGSEIGPRN